MRKLILFAWTMFAFIVGTLSHESDLLRQLDSGVMHTFLQGDIKIKRID